MVLLEMRAVFGENRGAGGGHRPRLIPAAPAEAEEAAELTGGRGYPVDHGFDDPDDLLPVLGNENRDRDERGEDERRRADERVVERLVDPVADCAESLSDPPPGGLEDGHDFIQHQEHDDRDDGRDAEDDPCDRAGEKGTVEKHLHDRRDLATLREQLECRASSLIPMETFL